MGLGYMAPPAPFLPTSWAVYWTKLRGDGPFCQRGRSEALLQARELWALVEQGPFSAWPSDPRLR